MNKKPNIALIGCGRWGRHILRDLKNLGCQVHVVVKSPKSKDNAINGNADTIVEALEELPASIDGVVIASPSITHYQVIKSICSQFNNELPIFTEKPMCINLNEAENIMQFHAGQIFIMHKWRYHQGIIELGKLARKSDLGALKGIKLYRLGWGNPHQDVDPIWILLPHDLSIVLEILGYIPEPVHASVDKTPNGIHGMTGMLESESHWVNFEVSERSALNRREVTLYFENGIASLTDSYKESIEIYHTSKEHLSGSPQNKLIPFDNEMPLFRELESFVNYVANKGDAPKSSAEEGYKVVSTIISLRELADKNS